MLKLDGSKLEGSGQLTRMALCLSAITGKAVKIHSIRAGRGPKSLTTTSKHRSTTGRDRDRDRDKGKRSNKTPKGSKQQIPLSSSSPSSPSAAGGLKESHLAALQWLAAQTCADVDGAEVGSTEVEFRPGALKGKYGPGVPLRATYEAGKEGGDNGTIVDTIQLKNPGSIWLIFQAIFPFMVFGSTTNQSVNSGSAISHDNDNSKNDNNKQGSDSVKLVSNNGEEDKVQNDRVVYDLTLIGGTNVPKSMSTEYVQQVFLPICEKIGLPRVQITTIKSGWTTGMLEVGEVNVKMYAPLINTATTNTTIPSSTTTTMSSSSSPSSYSNQTPSFELQPFALTERGTITEISITILSTPDLFPVLTKLLTTTILNHPTYKSLDHRQTQAAPSSPPPKTAQAQTSPPITIHSTTNSHHQRRTYILLVAHTSTGLKLGHDFLSSGGKPKNVRDEENMLAAASKKVVDALMREVDSGACVDEFMQDQIVAFQALCARGVSCVVGRDGGEIDHGFDHGLDRGGRVSWNGLYQGSGGGGGGGGGDADEECEDGGRDEKDESADRGGSLHTRTVRWVCEQIVDGVEFAPGGVCRKS